MSRSIAIILHVSFLGRNSRTLNSHFARSQLTFQDKVGRSKRWAGYVEEDNVGISGCIDNSIN